jgi:glycogen synthase
VFPWWESLATALREVADVHIITQVCNREAFIRAGMVEDEDFTSIDSERVARPLYRIAEAIRAGRGVGWTTATAIEGPFQV